MIDMKNNFFSKPLEPTPCPLESIKTKDSTRYQKITSGPSFSNNIWVSRFVCHVRVSIYIIAAVPKPGERTSSLPGQGIPKQITRLSLYLVWEAVLGSHTQPCLQEDWFYLILSETGA
jgi:hypothetical protein